MSERAVLHSLEMLYIRWELVERQIGKTFIEFAVVGYFDTLRCRVVPLDIFESVFERTEVDAWNRVIGGFGSSSRSGLDQNTTTNRSEVGEVSFLVVATLESAGGES